MDKQEFNKYCAEVMGWHLDDRYWHGKAWIDENNSYAKFVENWTPYDDTNQRHEVFDKLFSKETGANQKVNYFGVRARELGIDQAEREFIWSTKVNNDE